MSDTTSRKNGIDRLIDSNLDPAVAIELIDRGLAKYTNPRTRDVLLDMRIRAAFAVRMRAAVDGAR